jgi:glycosyltransferase involved in cell wall biosynthesis
VNSEPSAPTVEILLSTYNGCRFVAQQLDSLLAQDYPAIKIRVRDDGSTDGTLDVLRDYEQKDARVSLSVGANLGCVGSFFALLQSADANVLMFCDQDDVWLPSKVSSAVSALVVAGLQRPLLYHSDLQVVDERLGLLAPSFMAQQGLEMPRAHALEVLAIQNCVVGCTVAMTAELVRRAKVSAEVIGAAAMHDWWLAMFAACRGELIYSPRAEILYRQHGANVSGATRRSLLERIRLQFSTVGLSRINAYRRKVSRQARQFLAHYEAELGAEQYKVLAKVADLDPARGLMPVLRSQLCGIRFQNADMNLAVVYSAAITKIVGLLGAQVH